MLLWILFSTCVCVTLMIHAFVSRPPAAREAAVLRWWSMVARCRMELVCIWFWMADALPALVWLLWIGDNDSLFYDCAWVLAVGLAICTALLSLRRYVRGTATLFYAWLHLWAPVILLVLWGLIRLDEFTKPI